MAYSMPVGLATQLQENSLAPLHSDTVVSHDQIYESKLVAKLNNLRLDSDLTDVILMAGDNTIPCHKVVLAAGSSYFHAMFTCGLVETSSERVQLEHIEPEVLRLTVTYLYTGNVTITDEIVQNMVQAGDIFGLPCVKEKCEKYMISQLDISNCIGFHKFASIYQLIFLKNASRKMMMMNFQAVALGQEFMEMAEVELIEYIADDELEVSNKGHIFEAAIQWVRHNTELRKHCFESIVHTIPLHVCSFAYLRDIVKTEPLMQTQKCKYYLLEAFASLSELSVDSPRPTPLKLVVGGGCRQRKLWILKENDNTLVWDSFDQLPAKVPETLFICSVCCLKNSIIITGGEIKVASKTSMKSNGCWLLDTVTKMWTSLPRMTTARSRHASVVKENDLFVFGGETQETGKAMCSVEHLDMKVLEWNTRAPMPKDLEHPAAVIHGGEAFIFGGLDEKDKDSLDTFEYDISKNVWKTLSPMPEPCELGAAVSVGDNIYLVGGYNKACLSYTPQTDQWTLLSRPWKQHADSAAILWKPNKILLSGGRYHKGDTIINGSNIIEQYDIDTNMWTIWGKRLPMDLDSHFVVAIVASQ